MKSGELDVFATPALVAAAEAAAVAATDGHINEDETTVGGMINVLHTSPSVVGAKITATAELCEVDGKKLSFRIEVRDDSGIIGRGEHDRFIVNRAKFMSKAIIRSESDAK